MLIKKSNDIIPNLENDNRIHVLNKRYDIQWAAPEMMMAGIELLKSAIKGKFDYYILLSGQDLMIKKGIDEFLKKENNKIFLQSPNIKNRKIYDDVDKYERAVLLHKWPKIFKKRYDFKFNPVKMTRSLRIRFFEKFPNAFIKQLNIEIKNIIFYWAEYWFVIPDSVANYIIDYLSENPEYFEIFKDALTPEESWHITTIMKSKYANDINIIGDDAVGLSYIIPNGNHPVILTKEHIKQIESSGMFFARKFDEKVDNDVINYFYYKICK